MKKLFIILIIIACPFRAHSAWLNKYILEIKNITSQSGQFWQLCNSYSLNQATGSLDCSGYIGYETVTNKSTATYTIYRLWDSGGSCYYAQAYNQNLETVNAPQPNQIDPSLLSSSSDNCNDCPEGEEQTACGCKPTCPSGQRIVPTCECIPYCPYTNGRVPGTLLNPGGLCVAPPCSNQEITNPDGSCTHNCQSGQQMDETTGECFTPTPTCGPCESLVNGDCEPPPSCDAGTHRNYETCQCDETPEDTPECPSGNHYHWGFKKCVPDVICPDNGYYNGEKCVPRIQPPENPDPKVDPKTDPTPTPDRPEDPAPLPAEQPTPEPATPRSEDPWTAAVKDAVDRTNQQIKDLRNDLGKHKTDLSWIQSTMASVNENLGKVLNGLKTGISEVASRVETSISNGVATLTNNFNNAANSIKNTIAGVGSGLASSLADLKTTLSNKLSDVNAKLSDVGTKLSDVGTQVTGAVNGAKDAIKDSIEDLYGQLAGIDAGIGNITDELKLMNEGTYSVPTDKEPYTPPEHDFNQRTSQFLESVRSSPIFALPSQLSTSIPGGGSPKLQIDTGDTFGGIVEIDFSQLSSALVILRTVVQIMGITLAIRIITLKR